MLSFKLKKLKIKKKGRWQKKKRKAMIILIKNCEYILIF